MPFLLPPRRECRKTDVGLLLYNALRLTHGPSLAASIVPDCKSLQSLRVCLHDLSSPTTTSIIALKKYACAVQLASSTITSASNLPEPIVWADGYDPNHSITSRNILLDASGAYYNAGVQEAVLGYNAYNSADGDQVALRAAVQHMQRAASCFQVAQTTCKEGSDGYLALASAMLGNAQQAFTEGAIIAGASAGVIARLSAGAESFYAEAERNAGNWSPTAIGIHSASSILRTYMGCVASSRQADAYKEEGDISVRLAVLRTTISKYDASIKFVQEKLQQTSTEIKPLINDLAKDVLEKLSDMGDSVKSEFQHVEGQNRKHFFAQEALRAPALAKHQSVKAANMDDELKGISAEVKKLLPIIDTLR